MNAIIRYKSRHMKPYIYQNFKQYLKPNFCTYNRLKSIYNVEHCKPILSNSDVVDVTINRNHCTPMLSNRDVVDFTISRNQDIKLRFFRSYDYNSYRSFHTTKRLHETTSKVDATVKKLKTKQKEKVEEIMKEVTADNVGDAAKSVGDLKSKISSSATTAAQAELAVKKKVTEVEKPIVKKALLPRIWEEVLHYYHGFRLLFIDVKISSKLLWRVLNGKTLTRRENKLLLRTTSDLFRLIPFSVFIIVPFMELLLPLFIKFFPGMLPSTFQTAKEREDRLRQSLAVRLEMAKFLQKTLDEMPVQHKDHNSEEAKEFDEFFKKIKSPDEVVRNEDIIKFAKRFDDEITLDSLSREQLAALCRVLELNTIGTMALLRFQLRFKLRSLVADDHVIAREGVDSLDLFELQQACKARGMRAYGLTAERLRFQLREWIDLSLNEKVPSTLLLLSRTMFISDDRITTDKLKETMRVLPDAVAAHTKDAISESEGKVDHKAKIEIIKEEERRIKEEREEEREEIQAKRMLTQEAADISPYISADHMREGKTVINIANDIMDKTSIGVVAAGKIDDKTISSSDVRLLSDALKSLSSDKKLVLEKETIKELKEELADYKDDVEELREVRQVVKEPVHESRAAKLLYNRVNKMISQLDTVLHDLENKQERIRKPDPDIYASKRTDFIQIDELIQTIKRMKEASDETRLKVVEDLLLKLDNDKDGAILVNEVMKVVKNLDSTHNIDKKHLEEFTTLLSKQAQKRQEEEIVRIDDLMMNIKKIKETSDEARLKHIEAVLDKFDADKDGAITINEILKVVESIGRENIKLSEKQIEELVALLDKEQILHAEEKIEKAIAKSIKEAEKLKAEVQKSEIDSNIEMRDIAKEMGACGKGGDSENHLKDNAKEFKESPGFRGEIPMTDIAKELSDSAKELKGVNTELQRPPNSVRKQEQTKGNNTKTTRPNVPKNISTSTAMDSTVLNEAAERQLEKMLPQTDASVIPPTITTPPSTTTKAATKLNVDGGVKKIL